MKLPNILTGIVFTMFLTAINAQNKEDQELKKQQKDFAVFKNALIKIDAGNYTNGSDSVSSMLEAAEKEFSSKKLNPVDEFRWLAKCASAAHSSNTQVFPGKEVLEAYAKKKKSFPFDLIMINRRLYVTNKLPDTKKGKEKKKGKIPAVLPEGSEIISIDGKTIDQWIETISQYVGSEANNKDYVYVVAGNAFDFYRFISTSDHKEYVEVRYSIKDNVLTKNVRMDAPPMQLIAARLENANDQFKKDKKTDGKYKVYGKDAGCLTFPTFHEQDGFKHSQLLKKTFEKISKKKEFKVLVIDLRGNNGGSVQSELLGYLIGTSKVIGKIDIPKKPVRKELKGVKKNENFRDYKKQKRRLKKVKKKYPQYDGEMYSSAVDKSMVYSGKLVVLTDENTLGSAALLAAQLQFFRNASIVGSLPSCSPRDAGGNTLDVKLPSSGNVLTVDPILLNTQVSENIPDKLILEKEFSAEYDPKASNYKKNKAEIVKQIVDLYSKPQ